MAGFLAPQISETGGVGGGSSIPVDTSVADALSNVGRVFGTVAEGTGRREPTATQTDRDRIGLRETTAQIDSIRQQVEAGNLTPSVGRAKVANLVKKAGVMYPDKFSEIRSFASSVMGQEILEPQEDPQQQLQSAIREEAFNFDDPRNAEVVFKAQKEAMKSGQFNETAFDAALFRLIAERDFRSARNRELEEKVRTAELNNQLNEQDQNAIAQEKMADWTDRYSTQAEALVQSFAQAGPTIDRSQIIQQLQMTIAEARQEVTSEASNLLIRDNMKTLFGGERGGIDAAIAPLTNLLELVQSARDEDLADIKARAEISTDKMVGVLTEAGIPFGHNREVQAAFGKHLVSKLSGNLAVTADQMNEIVDFAAPNPWYQKTNGEFGIDGAADTQGSTQILTPENQQIAERMSEDEAKVAMRSGLAGFLGMANYDTADMADTLEPTVNNFIVGLMASNAQATPFNEASVEKVFSDRFWESYGRVQKVGGPVANRLNNALGVFLAEQTNLKRQDVQARVNTIDTLPGTTVVWNGEKFTIKLSEIAQTEEQEAVLNALRKQNLPLTLEGLKELRGVTRIVPPEGMFSGEQRLVNRTVPRLIDRTDPELRLLNKLVNVSTNLGDPVSSLSLPQEEQGEEKVMRITEDDDLASIPVGTVVEVESETGTTLRFRKQENDLEFLGEF